MNFVIEIAAYGCECVTLLLCIHSFLGEKIRVDYKTVLLVVADVTTLMIILKFNLPDICTLLVHMLFFLYVWWRFKISVTQNIILMLLDLLLMVTVQAVAMIPYYIIFSERTDGKILGLMMNAVSLILMLILRNIVKLNKLYEAIIKRDKIIIRNFLFCVMVFICLIIKYRYSKEIDVFSYFTTVVMICIIVTMIYGWQRDRYEIKRKNIELHMHKLYGKAFEGMVENIRMRQHDFKNQLTAIYGMHLTAESFEDLVECQRAYCNHLVSESRYDSILTKCNDKILAGFLYTKLNEAEKSSVEVKFDIVVENLNYKLELYEIIEIIGILIDNVIEYESEKTKKMYFEMKEGDEKLYIICRNVAEYISADIIYKFFKKGFSTKGKDRGLGLYNLKNLLSGKGEIVVTNQMIKNENWLEFKIEVNAKH